MQHEMFLAGSFYGKFFARNLHLTLLKRKPDEWKQNQARAKLAKAEGSSARKPVAPTHPIRSNATSGAPAGEDPSHSEKKRKRDEKPKDEIDALFATATKKPRNADSKPSAPTVKPVKKEVEEPKAGVADEDMSRVLGAIKAVPKGQALREGKSKSKKKHK